MSPIRKTDWFRRDYLRSHYWRQTRAAKMRSVGGLCERCLWRWATEVHHLRYDTLFHERPEDLKALCRECHQNLHFPKAANDNDRQFLLDLQQAPASEAHRVRRKT